MSKSTQIVQRKINRLNKQLEDSEIEWLKENLQIRLEELKWILNVLKEREAKK